LISITITLDDNQILKEVNAVGHAGGKAGTDIVCAAFTSLIRSIGATIQEKEIASVKAHTKERGKLSFSVSYNKTKEVKAYMKGITDVLLMGIQLLCAEYPDKLVNILKNR